MLKKSRLTAPGSSFGLHFLLFISSLLIILLSKKYLNFSSLSFNSLDSSEFQLVNFFSITLLILASICFSFFSASYIRSLSISSFNTIICFSLISFLLFYDPNLYFFWDEWNLIERFKEQAALRGSPLFALFEVHNEHFLPLAFFFYFLELNVFKDNYFLFLFTSSLIHALNAFTIQIILEKLTFKFRFSKEISKTLALLFLISSLHTETMQWAFEQTILLSGLFSFSSIYFFLKYIKDEKLRYFFYSAALNSLSPFFFGGGFIGFILTGVIFFLYLFIKGSFNLSYIYKFILYLSLSVVLPVSSYYFALDKDKENSLAPSNNISSKLLSQPKQILKYNLIGTQLGTIARGIGIYPGLSHGSARKYFLSKEYIENNPKVKTLNSVFYFKDPENIFFFLGLLFSSGLFLLYLNHSTASSSLSFFFSGQAWLFLAFLLPAIGRWQHGYPQALSLRYQYFALPGLLLILIPCIENLFLRTKIYFRKNTWGSILLFLIFLIYGFLQFKKISEFNYFTEKGKVNKIYLEAIMKEDTGEISLLPEPPITLTPNLSSEQIQTSVEYIRGS